MQVTARLFLEIKKISEVHAGHNPKIVITVPNYFSPSQTEELKESGKLAT